MKVLVGCEYSGTVRDAFIKRGHEAISCDLLPTESPGPHYRGDIMDVLSADLSWDLIILHPDCTYMAVSGNGTYANTQKRNYAVLWTLDLWNTAIKRSKRVCLENPQSVILPKLRQLGAKIQYIQPYQFGHPETKKTGLALHGLPELFPSFDVSLLMDTLPNKEKHKVWYASPGESRGKQRSIFFTGIANAMANQWG